jgi:hypothetical protein
MPSVVEPSEHFDAKTYYQLCRLWMDDSHDYFARVRVLGIPFSVILKDSLLESELTAYERRVKCLLSEFVPEQTADCIR